MGRTVKISTQLATVITLASLWEILYRIELIDQRFFPSISEIFQGEIRLVTQGNVLSLFSATLTNCVSGVLVATILGVLAGIVLGNCSFLKHLAFPIIEFLRPMPSIAVIPVIILILGLGNRMEIVVISFGAFWPVLVSTIYAIDHVDSEMLEVAKVFRLSSWDTIVKVILPASSQYILTGLRTAIGISLLLAVSVEMIAGNYGVGQLLQELQFSFRLPDAYALVILIGILGYLINAVFVFFENTLLHRRQRMA
jgi:ABC-type nitrate/sulfonate/bicarbonate transport system permease component